MNKMRLRRPRFVLTWALAAVVMAGTWGCGGSKGPAGRVSGKVDAKAGPVTEANVQLVRADGVPIAVAALNPAGEFSFAERIPTGDYRVAVLPIVEVASAEDMTSHHQVIIKKIPQKYWNAQTSGLTATVKEGENAFSFTLK
jgi:hypothetical protein